MEPALIFIGIASMSYRKLTWFISINSSLKKIGTFQESNI